MGSSHDSHTPPTLKQNIAVGVVRCDMVGCVRGSSSSMMMMMYMMMMMMMMMK